MRQDFIMTRENVIVKDVFDINKFNTDSDHGLIRLVLLLSSSPILKFRS